MAWQAHTHGNAWSEDEKTRQVLLTELSLSADSAQCDCIEECGPLCKSPGKMMMIFLFFLLFFCYNFDQDYDGHSWNLQTPVTYSDFVCTCLMKLSRNFSKRMECGPSCKATACGNRRVQEWRSKQGEAPRLVILKLQTTPYGLFAGQSFKEGAKSLYEEICCCIPFLACLTALTGSLVVIFVF